MFHQYMHRVRTASICTVYVPPVQWEEAVSACERRVVA